MIDKNKYVEDLRDQVEVVQGQHLSGLSDFRNAASTEAYKEALRNVAAISSPEDVGKAIALLQDKQQDISVREEILQKTVSAIGENPEYIRICLRILSDGTEPITLRKAALGLLKTLSFSSRTFVSVRSEYMVVLRSLLDEPEDSLREMAAEELSKYKDEFVQRRLLSGLLRQETPTVTDAKAIQLLGYDIHAEHYPVVRRLLESPDSDNVTKLEAIHVLANDPEAKSLLMNLVLDKEQDRELRMSSAMALQSGHPRDFTQMAKTLVLDESENKDVRSVLLNALTLVHPVEKVGLHEDRQFLEEVSRLHTSTTSPELKKMSSRYLENVRKQREQ